MADTSSAVKALTDVAVIGITAGLTMRILDSAMNMPKDTRKDTKRHRSSSFSLQPINYKL